MTAYWMHWLRAVLRSRGFLAWSVLGSVLFLAGCYLDVLAVDTLARRMATLAIAVSEAVAWGVAIVHAASPPMGESLEDSMAPTRIGPTATLLGRWLGASVAGALATIPTLATLLVLCYYYGHDGCAKQLIVAVTSSLTGGALLAAWTLLARPWVGAPGAALVGFAVWVAGAAVAPRSLRILVPAPVTDSAPPSPGRFAATVVGALGLALVAVALSRGGGRASPRSRSTSRDAA